VVMIVVRAYTVMDSIACEISCVHGDGQGGAHLLWRGNGRLEAGDLRDLLEYVAEGCQLAYRDLTRDELWESDDCTLA